MARIVNMHEAKTTLSILVEAAEAGEDVIIARAGQPIVRLVPIQKKKRKLGQWKGKVRMSDNFDAPLPASEIRKWDGGRR